jgi:hypothetical protein
MTKVDEYRAALRDCDDWDAFLATNAVLPGPRANLNCWLPSSRRAKAALALGIASSMTARPIRRSSTRRLRRRRAGTVVAAGDRTPLAELRRWANDSRWACARPSRSAAALGRRDVSPCWRSWTAAAGSLLQRRAVVAAVAEPRLLREPRIAALALTLLDRITAASISTIRIVAAREQALRKALAYGWSVVVAADPAGGSRSWLAGVRTGMRTCAGSCARIWEGAPGKGRPGVTAEMLACGEG